MQISLILKTQSISVQESSCENASLLAEAKIYDRKREVNYQSSRDEAAGKLAELVRSELGVRL